TKLRLIGSLGKAVLAGCLPYTFIKDGSSIDTSSQTKSLSRVYYRDSDMDVAVALCYKDVTSAEQRIFAYFLSLKSKVCLSESI
ncbi:hypothetical protein, partial [Acinetobacter baumannii]|uniref:hypothetical protein n=1 Tax=Acinetobacter baumannii TaxID=470 RepID=UPI001D0A2744